MIGLEFTYVILTLIWLVKKKEYVLLMVMNILFLIENFYVCLNYVFNYNNIECGFIKSRYNPILVYSFILAQFLFLGYYQIKTINYKRIRYYFIACSIILTIQTIASLFLYYNGIYKSKISYAALLWFMQSLLLLPGSIIFFYELIWFRYYKNILQLPEFWVHAGILSFSFAGTPCFLLSSFFRLYRVHNSYGIIIELLYCILIAMLNKSLICRKSQMK